MFKKKPDHEAAHAAAAALAESALDTFRDAADDLRTAADLHQAVAANAHDASQYHADLATRATAARFEAIRRADKIAEFLA